MEATISPCPVCGRKLRMPAKPGDFLFTCPACRARWDASAITHFEPDAARRAPLEPCIDPGADPIRRAEPGAEWPANLLSLKTVAFGSGRVAREGDSVIHDVDPAELELCRRLAGEAVSLLAGKVDGGLGTEGDLPFDPFWIAANRGEAAAKIDEALIRARFGGTIYPAARVDIQPLAEGAEWWSDVLMCAEETADVQAMRSDDEDEDPAPFFEAFVSVWRDMVNWFRERPEFVDAAFVAIGDYDHQLDLDREHDPLPNGAVCPPTNYPRLFVGLTQGGSLVGIVTYVVQT